MSIIDAYGHVSLPRFVSADEFLRVMDENDVESAVVCTAETCPDLAELSRAACTHGERMRAVGLPLGHTPQERRDCVAAQLDSGFVGIRIPDALAASEPGLLDLIGEAHATPFVVGGGGLSRGARALLGFLERFPECVVCAPHFAGVGDPASLTRDADVRALFEHPRFLVIFSRHGAFEPDALRVWTGALLHRVGFDRIMFGSEFPVCLWRDESYASTTRWIDTLDPAPDESARRAFLCGNARRHLFSRPAPPARSLDAKWCRMDLRKRAPVWLFPGASLEIPEESHRRLLASYLSRPVGERGSYREFVAKVLEGAAERLET